MSTMEPAAPAAPETGVPDVLRRIVARRRERFGVGDAAAVVPASAEPAALPAPLPRAEQPFLAALAARRGSGTAAVIAEVKMGSPRIGSLAGRVDPQAQARLYAGGGAAALSVVVEPDFFFGSYELLGRCREASGLPAIAKDFVVCEAQLDAAAEAGAAAILLIAALYTPAELARWGARARRRGLVPLVETHSADDVAKVHAAAAPGSQAPWELVGVNNRDLRTFDVDLQHSIDLLPELPAGCLRVAESGIGSGADVARLAAAGFDAFLIGESLLLAEDPARQLADLVTMGAATGREDRREGAAP